MCYVAIKGTGFPRERVLGMAGVLDTARYRTFLADAIDVSVEDIQAMVLGGHGDTMVPLISYTTVSGIPVTQLMAQDKLDAIVKRTRKRRRRDRGSSQDRLRLLRASAAAVQMVEAIALDKKRVLPCAVWLEGEYGLKDVFCGVPCQAGRQGAGAGDRGGVDRRRSARTSAPRPTRSGRSRRSWTRSKCPRARLRRRPRYRPPEPPTAAVGSPGSTARSSARRSRWP